MSTWINTWHQLFLTYLVWFMQHAKAFKYCLLDMDFQFCFDNRNTMFVPTKINLHGYVTAISVGILNLYCFLPTTSVILSCKRSYLWGYCIYIVPFLQKCMYIYIVSYLYNSDLLWCPVLPPTLCIAPFLYKNHSFLYKPSTLLLYSNISNAHILPNEETCIQI
jgi:hypothetical protein